MKKNKDKISNVNKINIVIHNNIKKKKKSKIKTKTKSKSKSKKGLLQLGNPSQYPMHGPVSTPYSYSLPQLPYDNNEAKLYSKSYNMLLEDKKNDINNNILLEDKKNDINNNLIKDIDNVDNLNKNKINYYKLENLDKIPTLDKLRKNMKKLDPSISDELLNKITMKNKKEAIDLFIKKYNNKKGYTIDEEPIKKDTKKKIAIIPKEETPQPRNSEFEEQIPLTQSNNSFIEQIPTTINNNNLIDQTPVSVNNKEYHVSTVKPRKQSKKAEKFKPLKDINDIDDIDDKSIHLSNYKKKLRSYKIINNKIELEDTINNTFSDDVPTTGDILDFNDE